jgi:hypothetical protein
MSRNIHDVISDLPANRIVQLGKPLYHPPADTDLSTRSNVALAVSSMRDHMTDEGYQIMTGLEYNGYALAGHGITTRINHPRPTEYHSLTNVPTIIDIANPCTLVLQDKREWDVQPGNFRDPLARFHNVSCLRDRPDIFKLTILKDAHQNPTYHRESADEIGCHAWIIYYHPDIVHHLAPYTRREHLIRTYHTVNLNHTPEFAPAKDRFGCLLSGAIGRGTYPLRSRLVQNLHILPQTTHMPHPGYHRKGCHTPVFLNALNQFKVAICTSSIYGYALRKIIEATACGCIVITDLPSDDVLPGGIDNNLMRVSPNIPILVMKDLIWACISGYDEERQRHYAGLARSYFDYRIMGFRLAYEIEQMRRRYNEL